MKKISLIRIASIVGVWAIALPIMAATTVSMSPTQVNLTAGKTFTVAVKIDPQGISNYAEKVELDYPASLVEVQSFNLADNWTPLAQPGYDFTDNVNGIMVKTAGYAGGTSQPTAFGTVTFYAKRSGTGTIMIGNGAIAFEAQKQSTLTDSGNGTIVTVRTVATPTNTPTNVDTSVTPSPSSVPAGTVTGVSPSPTPGAIPAQTVETAAVENAISYSWLWIIGAVIVIVAIGLWIFKRKNA